MTEEHCKCHNVTFGALACALTCVALGLVCAWAQYTPSYQRNMGNDSYLGWPSWKTNPFAWHVVFMVAGFFLSQVFSLASLIFFTDKTKAFFKYTFFHAAAICFLIVALRAIVKFKYDTGAPAPYDTENSLITLHSWIGVLAIISFAFFSVYGNVVGFTSFFGQKRFAPRVTFIHMVLAMMTLTLSVIAITSGISVFHGEHGCDPLHLNPDKTNINPAFLYGRTPWSCRLSNGIGISVLLATSCLVLGLLFSRSVALFDDSGSAEAGEGQESEPQKVEVEMTKV